MSKNWLSSSLGLTGSSQRSLIQTVRPIFERFASDCGVNYSMVPFSKEFYDACCEDGRRRDIPVDSLLPYIHVGSCLINMAYGYLPDQSTQTFLALYTALLVYVDDAFFDDIDAIRYFHKRFITGQPQATPALDSLVKLLQEVPEHYDDLAANIILTSSLNFITAPVFDYDLKSTTIPPRANKFVYFSRLLSGAAEAFALFIFPRGIPFQAYAYALPELMVFASGCNDVLSFYKEEAVGEMANFVSHIAGCNQVNKIVALQALANDNAAAINLAANLLKGSDKAAHDTMKTWLQGYINFHFSCGRYKLHELFP
ncbi:terpenoid synthase, partial [Pluteus cervinus]